MKSANLIQPENLDEDDDNESPTLLGLSKIEPTTTMNQQTLFTVADFQSARTLSFNLHHDSSFNEFAALSRRPETQMT